MKRFLPTFAIILGWALAAGAASSAPLTSLSAIHALSNTEAANHYPVDFEATVTYFRSSDRTLFVQEGEAAIYLFTTRSLKLVPGDRVRVRGITQPSFRPIVETNDITVLSHGDLPKPTPATYDELVRIQHDAMLVTVSAVVRSADVVLSKGGRLTYLHMLADGGTVDASIQSADREELKDLLDAEVEVTGVDSAIFDSKMQQTGVMLHCSALSDVKVLKPASASPWTLSITAMDTILAEYRVRDLTSRVRVRGTITYYQPGAAVVLQDGSKSIWVSTETSDPLQIGDIADAYGFPDVHSGFLNLVRAEIQDSHSQAPIEPRPETWDDLSTSDNVQFGHIYDLVSIEGQVVAEAREAEQDEYVLETNGHLFTAIYHHSDKASLTPLPPMKPIPIGSIARVSGICVELSSNQRNGPVPFDILLRSFDDISVVAKPSLLNMRNLLLVLGLLLMVVFIVIARGWVLERKVRRQTAVMSARIEVEADLERQRSRILEDINESRPLAEILMQIAAMLSSTLGGAPCWCELTDGERLGDCPQELNTLRIVRASIDARVGPALGTLFAGLKPDTPPIDRETVALHNGARLATLAIETRRLYADLRRRSEYDLLTDIPNRFALEKFIELQIEVARQSGRLFALIYIDLDKFKLINDTYGHHVGDLYLQEAALRMSHQLLGRDMLARLGGDEFAALVSLHNGLPDLDKIVARLDHCFDRPFAVGGYMLNGAASIGFALYPQEGTTKDSLLSAADAAMYVIKNSKHQSKNSPDQKPNPQIS
ncbi:MAG: GGDEF domain-containing protein [Terracidiphilus sp.]